MDAAGTSLRDESNEGRDLLVEMEFRRGHLRRNLRAALREAIQEGRLVAGTRLPSSRRLADDLQVSRGVVADTYDQLAAEGYLEVEPRRAPVVAGVARPPAPSTGSGRPSWDIDFVATTPDVELFPRRAWLRAADRALRTAPNEAFDYGDHRGRIELRLALADYLGRVRGVRSDPDRILVTQGFTQALHIACRILAGRSRTTIAFESPSLPEEWATARAAGLAVEACPVDEDGVRLDALERLAAAAIVVTPAHQFPTGGVMAASRRTALLAWASAGDGLVIEDDYDAEFRYDRAAVGALQGLDPGRVIHIGTASKTLAPGFRLGWMTLPADLVDEARTIKAAIDSGSPTVDQLALAELITTGDYERHIAKTRHVYRRRRDRLMASATAHLPGQPIDGAAAGLHVLLRLRDNVDDEGLARDAAAHGIGVRALSPMCLGGPARRGLLLGYGRLLEERIDAAVVALAEVLREVTPAPRT